MSLKNNEKTTKLAEMSAVSDKKQLSRTQQERTTSNNANISSQKQLLSLAKNFSLDGGLLPSEKQAPLEDRAHRRLKINELRKQQNLEAIIIAAIPYCSDEQATNKADQDWFNHFIGLAENISNKTMQGLWAKILAYEISQPGAFSYKTLQTFHRMSINDAKLFAKACALAMTDSRKKNIRIVESAYQTQSLFNFFNKNREQTINLGEFGLSYADILVLADNQLLFEQKTETSLLAKNETLQFYSMGKVHNFQAKKTDITLGFYKFTPIGSELYQLINETLDTDYFNKLKAALSENLNIN